MALGLRAEPDPFLLYIHYNEPRRPYYPPNSHLEWFTDEIAMSADEGRTGDFSPSKRRQLEDLGYL